MEVYALVGPSGTGKSHRAISVAHQLDVDVIIDDGLIIQDTRILGGFSAKRQPTRIGAIRAALFLNDEHAQRAKEIIRQLRPKKVLILATSGRMAEKIGERLELPPLTKKIAIEEIASQKEIRKARIERTQHSKHVIPAPAVEVKKSFPETLIDPLKIFFQRKGAPEKRAWLEQSIVRPTFTSHGKLIITHGALAAIVARAAEEVPGVKSAGKINITQQEEGVIIELHPAVYYGRHLFKISRKIQLAVKKRVEEMTGLTVKAVHVFIKELGFIRPAES
ncbi:MAG: Asp23/Gls24 family envelope stress response protein [Bacillota bacterium]